MIKTLIVEDEHLAAQRLEAIIHEVDSSIEIIGRTSSIAETRDFIANNDIDLMFLDISLSDGFSFSIFKNQDFKTPPIIFTTAYSEYAIKAFQLNSISYLMKPIQREHLKSAIEKYKHFKESDENSSLPYQELLNTYLKSYKKRFLIKLNNRLEKIDVKDIAYFYSEDKLTFIKLYNGKSVPFDATLKTLEEEVNPSDFFRINRKYILNINAIQEMYYTSKSKIQVKLTPQNNDSLPIFVAIEKLGQFKKWLSK